MAKEGEKRGFGRYQTIVEKSRYEQFIIYYFIYYEINRLQFIMKLNNK